MNPLMSMISGGMPQGVSNLMKMVGVVRNSGNPGAVLQNMAQNNPAIKQAMDLCQGKNPRDVFMQECQNRGVNPQQIMSMIK